MDITSLRSKAAVFLSVALLWAAYLPTSAGADTTHVSKSNMVRLSGKTASALRGEVFSSHLSSTQTVKLAVSLNLRNQADLEETITRIYNPKDSMYHHYLSKDDLTATYSPTQTDYDAVKNYLISKGLTVTNSDPNRLLIHVEGSAGTVEKALSLSLSNYKKADGSTYMRPDAEPAVSSDVADKISAISGLNTSVKHKPNYTKEEPSIQELESVIQNSGSDYVSATTGYGPIDIKSAYNLSSTPLTGAGQTIALVEFDGYIASDVNYYVNAFKNYFGSSYTPSVIFEPVAGYNGAPITANGASEVMLDIDMALNLAPAATIEVFCDDQYTDNNADVDMLEALYNNLTSGSISESWGIPEVFYAGAGHGGTLDSATDHAYYELLAAEGLSFFAASGDNGTYDAYNDGDSTDLCVNYPASDPNVTGVGGTTLNTTAYTVKLHNEPVTGADGAYKSETPWNDSVSSGYPVGGGGGISALFTIPWYQSLSGIMTSASLGSSTHRNVPDVSLNADQYAGYAVYVAGSTYATPGSWQVYGGTSAATPLWAAFTALVNQNRAANGLSNIGFINPVLYNLSLTPSYATSFHDIADGHTNGYYPTANDYPAVTGYDLATGLGTFNGVNLISALSTETQTPAPTFAPAAGIYPSAQSVSISDSLSGATIFYTTDGSTPDTSSAIYSSPISVSATETINAIAVKSGYTDSQETSASYIISSETQIATPTFSLTPGTYTTSQSVSISDSQGGVTIYYTTDGSTPTTSSTVYTVPITLSATVASTKNIKAIAVSSGYITSSVASTTYTIAPVIATPTFSPIAGTYTSSQLVYISDSQSGATIYYTTDGSTPTVSSSIYSSSSPILVNASETINAIAVKAGYTNSPDGSAAYIIETQVPTPTFSLVQGTYAPVQTVSILDSLSGVTIYYTTDGSTPTTLSSVYSTPITVSASEIIKAFAVETDYTNSSVASATYSIETQVPTPTFSPTQGTYTSAQSVSILDSLSGVTIYYTTDGSVPTTSSSVYSTAISVSASETINAIAVKTGYLTSSDASAAYTIQNQVPTPTFSPAAGTYTSVQSVSILDSLSGATIYYTTDGSTPTTSSSVYSTPISVSSTETINAIAVKVGYVDSSDASSAYTINLIVPTPTFSPTAGTYSSAQSVSILDSLSGVTIYYTTDGSIPTSLSSVYSTPISVSSTETINAIAVEAGYADSSDAAAAYTIEPQVPTPTFSPAAGTYSSAQSVSISDTLGGVTIYYTTDGSTPTTASSVYSSAISVSASETIKAIAVKTGDIDSSDASAAYTITSILHGFGAGWQMISSPVDSSSESLSTIFSTTPTAVKSWVSGNYSTISDGFTPGKGYWINDPSTTNLLSLGTPVSTSQAVSVSLQTGWNLIGNPRTSSVSLNTLKVVIGGLTYSLSDANTLGYVYPTLYTYQSGDSAYETTSIPSGSLQPYYGYWIYVFTPMTLTFPAE